MLFFGTGTELNRFIWKFNYSHPWRTDTGIGLELTIVSVSMLRVTRIEIEICFLGEARDSLIGRLSWKRERRWPKSL